MIGTPKPSMTQSVSIDRGNTYEHVYMHVEYMCHMVPENRTESDLYYCFK